MARAWKLEATRLRQLLHWRQSCSCCTRSAQVQARAAAFYTAAAAFFRALGQQCLEDLRATDAGRPAVLWELPTFQLKLPDSWVQHTPGRLEMCKDCATLVEEVGGQVVGRAGGRAGGRVCLCGEALGGTAVAGRYGMLCCADENGRQACRACAFACLLTPA